LFPKTKILNIASQKIWYHFLTFFRLQKINYFFQQDSATLLIKRETEFSPSGFWEENNRLDIVASLLVRYQPGQSVVMGHDKVQKVQS